MNTPLASELDVMPQLLEAIAPFPLKREVSHCGTVFAVSSFDIYATCPVCKARIKVRSFTSNTEIEDVSMPCLSG